MQLTAFTIVYSLDSRRSEFYLVPLHADRISVHSSIRVTAPYIRGQFLADILRSHVVAERPNSSRRASFTGLWMYECKLVSVPRNQTRISGITVVKKHPIYTAVVFSFELSDLFMFEEYYNYHFFCHHLCITNRILLMQMKAH